MGSGGGEGRSTERRSSETKVGTAPLQSLRSGYELYVTAHGVGRTPAPSSDPVPTGMARTEVVSARALWV